MNDMFFEFFFFDTMQALKDSSERFIGLLFNQSKFEKKQSRSKTIKKIDTFWFRNLFLIFSSLKLIRSRL